MGDINPIPTNTCDAEGLTNQSDSASDVTTRLESLMVLAKENLDELQVQLLALLEENTSLKQQLEVKESNALFQIDTEPAIVDLNGESSNGDDDMRYESSDGRTVLGNNTQAEEEMANKKSEDSVVKQSCFNCCGDHQLPDCTEPRDQRKINQNRREFMANSVRSARYHIDENQKFGQFQPGLPSPQLRQALGLQEDQLPSYIYRMRELGHPPGWLKAAEINHSGLGIYVEKDQKVPDAIEEEGEIAESMDKIQYDFDKLPEWPGFNMETPEIFRDESRRYNVPRIQDDQLKSYMLTRLRPKAQKGYVRKEMTNSAKRMKLDESVPSSPTVEIQNGDVDSVTGRSTEIPTDRTPPRATLREIAVLSVDAGTPICTLYSPFPNLPAQAKWATNTTDHIMFENLPESTGKYENIRGIITKIRENKKLDFDAMADVV